MKVHILRFSHLYIVDAIFDGKNPSQEASFGTVFCVLYDTSSKVYAINTIMIRFESTKLESINFFHNFQSKAN
jgi:hypothetical protein